MDKQQENGQSNHPDRSRKSNRGHRANEDSGNSEDSFFSPNRCVSNYKDLVESVNSIPASSLSSECRNLFKIKGGGQYPDLYHDPCWSLCFHSALRPVFSQEARTSTSLVYSDCFKAVDKEVKKGRLYSTQKTEKKVF